MVGRAGGVGGPVAGVSGRALRSAYGRAAGAWAAGPQRLYRRLSEELVASCPAPLSGRLVLDLGCGTGAASRVCAAAGARVVAVDAAVGMLAHERESRPPAVAGDAYRLPFLGSAFDALVAAFVLNHLEDPVAGLVECARVTRPGGRLLAATFRGGWTHPAKDAVDGAAASFGWRPPEWYTDVKQGSAPALGAAEAFAAAAADAGWEQVEVAAAAVESGMHRPADLAAWRLGMAQYAEFLAALPGDARSRLWAEAVHRVAAHAAGPLRPEVLFCLARRPEGRRAV